MFIILSSFVITTKAFLSVQDRSRYFDTCSFLNMAALNEMSSTRVK